MNRLDEALTALRSIAPPTHGMVAVDLYNIAETLFHLGGKEEAAVRGREAARGEDNEKVISGVKSHIIIAAASAAIPAAHPAAATVAAAAPVGVAKLSTRIPSLHDPRGRDDVL